ncbi:MAG TPA: hypothetical protein VGO14_01760 [Solirubrobacteraceae bacterium]|jgi:hypothetical protein|nr:hypothetical protein [Solirubrobacteraceae bacterium]
MKTGTLGIIVVGAVLALGPFAAGAAASTPKVWLIDAFTNTHATVGEAANIRLGVSSCGSHEAASVSTNGRAIDQIAGSGTVTTICSEGNKLAGTITSVAVTPGTSGAGIMTVTDRLHVGVEPWCTYTLPSKIAFSEYIFTESVTTVTSTLDTAASFGSCAPTRSVVVQMVLEQVSEGSPYEALAG